MLGTNAKRPAVLNRPLPCFSTHLQVKGKKQGIVGEMVTKMSLSGWEKEEHGRGSAHARHSALLPTLIPHHSSSSSSSVPLNHRRISHHQNPSDAIRMTLYCGSSVCDIYPRFCVPQMMGYTMDRVPRAHRRLQATTNSRQSAHKASKEQILDATAA